MNTGILRMLGYFAGFVVTDIAVGLWEEHKMRREMRTYENENGGTLAAHHVTEETAGPVMTVGGTSHDATAGDVLVGTDRPDVYTVADAGSLDGYAEVEDTPDDTEVDQGDAGSDFGIGQLVGEVYDPSAHTVPEVLQYLTAQDTAGNDPEVDRVLSAEREGKSRAGVLAFDA